MGGAACGRWQLQLLCLQTTNGIRPFGGTALNPVLMKRNQ